MTNTLWGKTYNQISPSGTYTDNFQTDRILLQGKIAGQLKYAHLTLTPNISGTYTTDSQKEYIDTLNNTINAQQINLAQMSLGLDFSTPLNFSDQIWMLAGGVSSIYSNTSGTGAAASIIAPYRGIRARIHLGISLAMQNGGSFAIKSFYDGIGTKEFQAYGINLSLNNKF